MFVIYHKTSRHHRMNCHGLHRRRTASMVSSETARTNSHDGLVVASRIMST